jgi:heme A synthase
VTLSRCSSRRCHGARHDAVTVLVTVRDGAVTVLVRPGLGRRSWPACICACNLSQSSEPHRMRARARRRVGAKKTGLLSRGSTRW